HTTHAIFAVKCLIRDVGAQARARVRGSTIDRLDAPDLDPARGDRPAIVPGQRGKRTGRGDRLPGVEAPKRAEHVGRAERQRLPAPRLAQAARDLRAARPTAGDHGQRERIRRVVARAEPRAGRLTVFGVARLVGDPEALQHGLRLWAGRDAGAPHARAQLGIT